MCNKQQNQAFVAWLAIALIAAGCTYAPACWSLDLARVHAGEWWRLASGHFVHLSYRHYLYNQLAIGLAILFCLRVEEHGVYLAATAFVSAISIAVMLLSMHPVAIYGGLSGIIAGLIAFGTVRLFEHGIRFSAALLVGIMLLKIVLERQGISASGVQPVWQAHCAGAAAGAVMAAFCRRRCAVPPP